MIVSVVTAINIASLLCYNVDNMMCCESCNISQVTVITDGGGINAAIV